METEKILEKAKKEHNLKKDEIIELLNSDGALLYSAADDVRKKYKGGNVHLRGLIEFSNICKQNCFYCGLRSGNKKAERYRMSADEIFSSAQNAVNAGYKTIVLQSGEDSYYTVERLADIIRTLKKNDVVITLSIGERTFDEYKILKEAGAERYLLRIETTDRNLYGSLHPEMSIDNRFECLHNLKQLGYETGTGVLVGLPGQSVSSLADDILFFKELDADMAGIGPFIPHPETPLRNADKDNFDMALKVMSITRLILPDINIPATTAMETSRENGRMIALNSGANVVMPNMTTGDYRRKYEIYPDKICINDSPAKCIGCIKSKIEGLGRKVSNTKGYRKNFN